MALKGESARERILEMAGELFYRQGYQGTGINQIVDESGVAKATFYAHFKSKEELCLAYLEQVSAREFELVHRTLEKKRSALARYLAPFEVLEEWLKETHYRGCPFLNIASEVPDAKSPIRQVGKNFYTGQRRLVEQLVRELREADPKKYGSLQPEQIAERYVMILIGMIGLCEIFQRAEPYREGIRLVQSLVE